MYWIYFNITAIILLIYKRRNNVSKYKFKTNQDGIIDFKVIPYPKYKKVLSKGHKFVNFKNLSIILLIISIGCTYFFLTNKRLSYLIDKKEYNSVTTSDNNAISNSDFNNYSKIIESNINYEHNIKTESMHKNGSYLYAHGVILSNKDNNLYFDIILKNNKPHSLIINDIEYIQK